MRIRHGRTGVLRAAVLVAVAGGVAGGCAPGHGKHVEEFKQQAQMRMASLKAATKWDMAHQQFQAGDLRKALDNVDDSIALDGSVSKSHLLRGRILIEMDRLETALQALDRAIEVDPQNAEAHYYAGIVYERFVRFERAMERYQRAAELDGSNPQYRLAAAEMLIQTDRIDEAEATLKAGMSVFEHNPGFRQTLGHIAMMRADAPEAVRLFGEACLLAPADQGLMEDLARAQIAAQKFADAEYTLRRLSDMESQVNRRDLAYLRAKCLMELDRPVEARSILLELTQDARGSGDVDLWIELGRISVILNEDHRLRQCAQRVMNLAPRRSEGPIMLASWQHRTGKTEEAIRTLGKAIAVSDDPASLAVMQGALYRGLGRVNEAREAARLALRHDPADARAQRLLGKTRVADVPVTE